MSDLDGRRITLGSETHRAFVGSLVKATPAGWVIEFEAPRRSLPQNSYFHRLLQEIADAKYDWGASHPLDKEDLKTLFVSGWMIETGQPSEIISGLDGKPVQLRRSTTKFSKPELSSLIEYTYAECAKRGIVLTEPQK